MGSPGSLKSVIRSAQIGRGDPTREPMAGAGRLLAQDESDGSRVWCRLVYVNKRKPGAAGARFLPWCACPLSPACRSAGRSDICWAGMTTGPDRWLSPPRQTDAASIHPSWGGVWCPSSPMCPAASCRFDLALLLSAVWCWLSQQGESDSGCGCSNIVERPSRGRRSGRLE